MTFDIESAQSAIPDMRHVPLFKVYRGFQFQKSDVVLQFSLRQANEELRMSLPLRCLGFSDHSDSVIVQPEVVFTCTQEKCDL